MMPAPRDASTACRDGDAAACTDECAQGAATACLVAGDAKRACELGSLPACTSMAVDTLREEGSASSLDKRCARSLLDVACNAKVPDACANLGLALLETAPHRARDVLERACDALGRSPCLVLGTLLSKGSFGEKEPVAAKAAFRRGCDTGEMRACALLRDGH